MISLIGCYDSKKLGKEIYSEVTYVRQENEQLEISGGSVTKFDINWIDECVYTLTSRNSMDSIVEVEIINEIDSGYRYISRDYVKGKLTAVEVGVLQMMMVQR